MNAFLKTVEPHIVSDDLILQRSVMCALEEYPYIPIEWTADFLRKSRESRQAMRNIIYSLGNVQFDDKAIKELIQCLKFTDEEYIHSYKNLLHHISPDMIIAYKTELEPYISDEDWYFYHRLVTINDMEKAYFFYFDTINRLIKSKDNKHQLFEHCKRAIEMLIENDFMNEWEVELRIQEIRNKNDGVLGYEGLLNVYAMGIFREPKWIPLLVSMLEWDDDILVEEASSALICYQSDEVVEAVYPLCNSEDYIFPIGVLRDTKTESAVSALKQLYHETNGLEIREYIAEGLCSQFSLEGLPEIELQMKQDYRTNLVEMEESAYTFYTVVGENHPDLHLWYKESEKREHIFQTHLDNDSVNKTIAKAKKVGRNEPCPCGSGKKYKKCCGV